MSLAQQPDGGDAGDLDASSPAVPASVPPAPVPAGPDASGPAAADLAAVDAVSGPTVLRILLGTQLRRLREAAGLTPEEAGYEIRASRSKISRVEHGRVSFKERDVADLLTMYGVTDEQEREHLLTLAQHANSRGWWARYDDVMPEWFATYVGLEQATSLIRTYELQFVPGLFQTEEYARAVTLLGHRAASAEEIDRRVSLRLMRQQILTVNDPPRVWAVIDKNPRSGGRSAAGMP